jgi:molybdenum-dependent DNA-binding transcriptional regulator ModE
MSTNYNHWFIRARLKTRQLLLLVALAEEGNIHRAAQVLNMTQPAASKLLKDLEDVLEVPLFERLPRGMRPTWYGETMIRHARMALASLNQAHDELTALKAGRFGHVAWAITSPGSCCCRPRSPWSSRSTPPARLAGDRNQPGADGAAGAGQAGHPGGTPLRRARQDESALRAAGRGTGLRHGAAGPSAAGRERASRCATWWRPAGSCRPRAACCGTASS